MENKYLYSVDINYCAKTYEVLPLSTGYNLLTKGVGNRKSTYLSTLFDFVFFLLKSEK